MTRVTRAKPVTRVIVVIAIVGGARAASAGACDDPLVEAIPLGLRDARFDRGIAPCVRDELSEYDLKRGRITYRFKKRGGGGFEEEEEEMTR